MAPKGSAAAAAKKSAPTSNEELRDVAVSDCKPSQFQFRTEFDEAAIKELAGSIREKGVEDRLLVRKGKSGGFEIIDGERRWRAAKLAGLSKVPVRIAKLTDDEARERAVDTFLHREGLHPIDECTALVALMEQRKETPAEVAKRVSKKIEYVEDRLALRDLCEPARKEFRAGKFGLRVARALSRVKPAAAQVEAVKTLTRHLQPGETVSVSRAIDTLGRQFMYRLAQAPFDVNNAQLVPEAGACGPCPENSAAQRTILADLGKEDLCTNGKCWDKKRKADADERLAKAKAAGRAILPVAEVKKLFPYSGDQLHSREFARLDQRADPHAYGENARTWEDVLGKRAASVPVFVARLESGDVVELAKVTDMTRAVKAAPQKSDPAFLKPKPGPNAKEVERKREAKKLAQIQERARANMVDLVVRSIVSGERTSTAIAIALDVTIARALGTNLAQVAARRGLQIEGAEDRDTWAIRQGDEEREALIRHRADLSDEEKLALLLEINCGEPIYAPPFRRSDDEDEDDDGTLAQVRVLERAVKELGIDVAHHEREAERQLDEEAAERAHVKKHGRPRPTLAENLAAADAERGVRRGRKRKTSAGVPPSPAGHDGSEDDTGPDDASDRLTDPPTEHDDDEDA